LFSLRWFVRRKRPTTARFLCQPRFPSLENKDHSQAVIATDALASKAEGTALYDPRETLMMENTRMTAGGDQ
jgi:hypothetical protein